MFPNWESFIKNNQSSVWNAAPNLKVLKFQPVSTLEKGLCYSSPSKILSLVSYATLHPKNEVSMVSMTLLLDSIGKNGVRANLTVSTL